MDKLIKTHEVQQDSTSHTFLTGAILFANLDYSGLTDYAVKAAIGGIIWMVFKLTGDYLSFSIIARKKRKQAEAKGEIE
jgi:hypothetical protein